MKKIWSYITTRWVTKYANWTPHSVWVTTQLGTL